MTEVLEGVFSETLLDEIASDLGIEAGVLRNSPFFRVIKGRVLLTYPLKTSGTIWELQELEEWSMTTLTTATYYPILEEENCKLIIVKVLSDEIVDRTIDLKITADNQVFSRMGFNCIAGIEHYCFVDISAMDTPWINALATSEREKIDLEGKDVKIELAVTNPTADKTFKVSVLYATKG